MRTYLLLVLLFLAAMSMSAFGQTDADREGLKRAALNYAEGWYAGNAEMMESALSADLAKRRVVTNEQGKSRIDQMTAMTLVQATRAGYGKRTPKDEQQKDVTILDVFGGAAIVKLEMRDWIDYLHVGKIDGKWLIVNVLWETKPKKEEKKN